MPFYFHLSTFLAFLIQIVLMGLLFRKILGRPEQAWLGAALYGLHPVAAETVNYIIQRADLYVALGLVTGMLLYAHGKHYGSLIPFGIAYFAKPSALVFPGLILSYEHFLGSKNYKRALPHIFLAAILVALNTIMTPSTFLLGANSEANNYRLTQPYIAMTYLIESVAPFHLAADNEFPPFENLLEPSAVLGYIGVATILWVILKGKNPALSFGLSWFLMAMAPTSLAPLGDVTNDHRMFGPFVGLALAFASLAKTRKSQWFLLFCLPFLAYGAKLRNDTWKTDESLWRDAVAKRPQNGRAWLNLGVCLLHQERFTEALVAMLETKALSDSYVYLEVNLGQVYNSLQRYDKAEKHYIRATEVDPGGTPLYLYGEFLLSRDRPQEGIPLLVEALKRNPMDHNPIQILKLFYDRQLLLCQQKPSSKAYLDFALLLYLGEEYLAALNMAEKACKLEPQNAIAHNTRSGCYLALRKWKLAEEAAARALELDPTLEIANRNLSKAQMNLRQTIPSSAP